MIGMWTSIQHVWLKRAENLFLIPAYISIDNVKLSVIHLFIILFYTWKRVYILFLNSFPYSTLSSSIGITVLEFYS